MQVAPVNSGTFRSNAFELEQVLDQAENGDWIIVPDGVQSVSVTLIPSSATAKVQTTTDNVDTVKNGSPDAVDWDYGSVTVLTSDVFWPVTALRLVQESTGSSKLKVRAQ